MEAKKKVPRALSGDRREPPKPRPLRLANTLPYEDHISAIFNHHVDIVGRTIFMDSLHVDADGGDSGTDASMHDFCVKALTLLEQQDPTKPIKIVTANFGGSFDYGIGIYDRIKLSPCPTVLHVYGPIMSMGSVIFQAGDKRLLAPNAIMMLHYLQGSYEMHDSLGETSVAEHKRANELMLEIYIKRIKEAGKDIKKAIFVRQIKNTLYLTAKEAVEMGLADGIITKA